jgi:hypothetical protein
VLSFQIKYFKLETIFPHSQSAAFHALVAARTPHTFSHDITNNGLHAVRVGRHAIAQFFCMLFL